MADPSPPMDEHPHLISRNARYGIILFVVYVVFYAGFVALAAFSFDTLKTNIRGVNLAIVYGLGLIVLAFVLALIYMALCGRDSNSGGGA